MRRYGALFAAILVAAVALALVRAPKNAPARLAPVAAPAPSETLMLVVSDGSLTPALAAAPKGSRVWLIVKNRGASSAQLALAGYEGRLAIPPLSPGVSWSGAFTADLPGDDFAWLIDGKPAARFRVTGSHLVEGHR